MFIFSSVTVWIRMDVVVVASESSALEKSWNVSTWALELDDLSMPTKAEASMLVECIVDNAATITEAVATPIPIAFLFRFALMLN